MVNMKGQRSVQLADEAVAWGTPGTPWLELSGVDPDSIRIPPSVITEIVRAARGGLTPGRDTITVRHEVSGVSMGGHVIYESIPYILEMLDEVTATGGGAAAYTYNYVAPTTAQMTPRPQTLVMGVGDAVYGLNGACISSITFEWEWGQPLKYTVDLMGHSVTADAFNTLNEVASATLTYALASQCTVYVDALSGTLGATAANKVPKGSITINCNRKYQRRVGSLYPTGVYDSPYWDITGNLTFEEDSTTAGWADAIIVGATAKLIRIRFTNGGATTSERSLTFDLAALCRITDLSTDDNDMQTVDLSFEPIEEGDWTTPGSGDIDGYFEITAINNTAALYA